MNDSVILRVESYGKQFMLHEQNTLIPSSHDVNLDVYRGKLTALIGPTGAGKSTVLKGIYRTYLPTAGRLLYTTEDNVVVDLASADEHRILNLRKNEIAFVTQFLHCLPRQSTLNVVAQPLVKRGWAAEKARSEAGDLLKAMNLPERLWEISPATFSGGEKQRVNLARGLIAKPRLLLLDEPTASLDGETAERVIRLIEALKHKGVGILAIFHHPDVVKLLADNVVEIQPPANSPVASENITLEDIHLEDKAR